MTQTTAETTLQIRRTFKAPRELVYQAWTDPAYLAKWYCQSAARHSCDSLTVDLRVGGKLRADLRNNDTNEGYAEIGEYREIIPNEKLVFTFRWEDAEMDCGETLMVVEFFERSGHTEVVLTHSGFPAAEVCDRHRQGWEGCLDKLAAALAG